MEDDRRNSWLIPGAILAAGVILAYGVYTINHKAALQAHGDPSQMTPVSPSDHILGNPKAPVMIVEYADIDSPYSKDFQSVMTQVMQDNASSTNVAWVFREFPLVDQNQYAEADAEAAECVAAQGGTSAFFSFINTLQAAVPGDGQFNPADFSALIKALNLNQAKFDQCMSAHTYRQVVANDYENALAVGATGSPYNILLVKGQKPKVISGAIPYSTMKQIIQQSISEVLAQ